MGGTRTRAASGRHGTEQGSTVGRQMLPSVLPCARGEQSTRGETSTIGEESTMGGKRTRAASGRHGTEQTSRDGAKTEAEKRTTISTRGKRSIQGRREHQMGGRGQHGEQRHRAAEQRRREGALRAEFGPDRPETAAHGTRSANSEGQGPFRPPPPERAGQRTRGTSSAEQRIRGDGGRLQGRTRASRARNGRPRRAGREFCRSESVSAPPECGLRAPRPPGTEMEKLVASLAPCIAAGARAPEHLGSERARKRVGNRVQRRFEACVKRCEARLKRFQRRFEACLKRCEARLTCFEALPDTLRVPATCCENRGAASVCVRPNQRALRLLL